MIFDREELLSPHLDAEQVLIMFFLKAAFFGSGLHGNLLQIFTLSKFTHDCGVMFAFLTFPLASFLLTVGWRGNRNG